MAAACLRRDVPPEILPGHDRQQLDAARQQAARVEARAQPGRPIIALVLAAITAAVSRAARADAASVFFRQTPFRALGRSGTDILADLAAVAFCLLVSAATRPGGQRPRGRAAENRNSARSPDPLRGHPARRAGHDPDHVRPVRHRHHAAAGRRRVRDGADRHRRAAKPVQPVRGHGPGARPACPRRRPGVHQVKAAGRRVPRGSDRDRHHLSHAEHV